MSDVIHFSEFSLPDAQVQLNFSPPPRFGTTSFTEFSPQHPSQASAVVAVQEFVAALPTPSASGGPQSKGGAWFWTKKPRARKSRAQGRGLYLDGGFGVGKTHLLAAAYHAATQHHPADTLAYLSFQELVYAIGMLGMAQAKRDLTHYTLYCIDEFELDDPGNTLIVKTFLKEVFANGHAVLTTSNTPPQAQGEGRFNAEYFQREIQSIASHFDIVLMAGPDYRQRSKKGTFTTQEMLEHHKKNPSPMPKVLLRWEELLDILTKRHPIRYQALLNAIGTLYVTEVTMLKDQNDALRFAHFIDKVYDLNVCCRMTPAQPDMTLADIYSPQYVHGAFAKKYNRSLSRLAELFAEDCTV